jgi:tetratricopeptide (TPR) repeat protein
MISRLANWILYAVILAVIGALIYYYTDWFKPATQKAVSTAKSVVESIPVGPFSKKAADEVLNQAREAYSRGDADAAIRSYTEFLAKHPDSIDGHGELGNVYYMTGRLQEAAQSFFEAGKRMLDQNQADRAQALLPSIGQGNPALAGELQQKLMQLQQPQQQAVAPMQGQMPPMQGEPAMPPMPGQMMQGEPGMPPMEGPMGAPPGPQGQPQQPAQSAIRYY